MAFVAAALPFIQAASAVMTVLGGLAQANAMKASARANQRALDIQAGQEEAAGQHRAEQDRRKAALMMSRAIAVGAASGAGVSGMEGLLAGISREGEKAAQGSMYTGKERANNLRYRGAVGLAEAKAKAKATVLGSVVKAGMSLYDAYKPDTTMDASVTGASPVYESAGDSPFDGKNIWWD